MEPPEISYRTIPVVRKDIEDSVRVTGYFVYAEQRSVQFRLASGRLREIFVSYGDIVEDLDLHDCLAFQFGAGRFVLTNSVATGCCFISSRRP